MSALDQATRVILCGTESRNPRGGIGVAMPGYQRALDDLGLLSRVIPTYDPNSLLRHALPALQAVGPVFSAVRRLMSEGYAPVVYTHAGAGLAMIRESGILAVARAAGARTMIHLHSPRVREYVGERVRRRAVVSLLSRADRVCCLSTYWADLLLDAGVRNVAVVPNPLPPEAESRARAPWEPTATEGPIRLLAMSRLVAGKGLELSLQSVARVGGEFRLDVAGDGPLLPRLRDLARDLGLEERVRFLGWISGAEKVRALEAADALIAPTAYDAMPMSFLEANCYRLPVVAVRWGPIEVLVEHGVTGLLAERRSADAIAIQLGRLADRAFLNRLAQTACDTALERYSTRAVSERLRAALPDPR